MLTACLCGHGESCSKCAGHWGVSAVQGYQPYPSGPRDEAAAVEAAKEGNSDGLLTGGPRTPIEWRHWNAAREAGWEGRWPLLQAGGI